MFIQNSDLRNYHQKCQYPSPNVLDITKYTQDHSVNIIQLRLSLKKGFLMVLEKGFRWFEIVPH